MKMGGLRNPSPIEHRLHETLPRREFVGALGTLFGKELHQIRLQTQNGAPVARERDAIKDIEEASGINPEFHAYNDPKD